MQLVILTKCQRQHCQHRFNVHTPSHLHSINVWRPNTRGYVSLQRKQSYSNHQIPHTCISNNPQPLSNHATATQNMSIHPPFKILLKYNGLQLTYRVVNSGNQNRYKQYYFNTSNSHCVCPEKLISCDIPSFTYQTLDHKSTWENSSSVKLLYCSKACQFPLWLLS